MQEHPNTSGSDEKEETPQEQLPQHQETEPSREVTPQDHSNSPESESPSTEQPVAETPVAETPVSEEPAAESPVEESPVEESPVAETPVIEVTANDTSAESPANNEETPQEVSAAEEQPETEVTPQTETPAESAEGETPTSSESVVEPEPEKEPFSPAQALLEELLKEDENFEKVVSASSPAECILLMEAIAAREELRKLAPKVAFLKARFDQMEKAEDSDLPVETISRFNTAYARFNKRRADLIAKAERSKEENSRLKFALLERLKKIVEEEEVDAIEAVREIQSEWKDIGWVLQKDIDDLNKTYSTYLDVYYNLRGQYNALRDLDRQHNMTEKEKIITEITSLTPAEDSEQQNSRDFWKESSEKVRALQEHFKTIGPVPRENLDDLMTRYRAELDKFYGARQIFYNAQDEEKKGNIALKQEVIDKLIPYAAFASEKAKEWNQATKEVLALQEDWKKLGPAPREINRELWKLYRQTCDAFFESKSEFFKKFDEIRAENLKKKIALCEQAEALKENENFKETAEKLKGLQSEWKTIGPVHDRYSNKVWKRFRKACDHFFNRRDDSGDGGNSDYKKNQETKEALIKELKGLLDSDNPEEHVNAFKNIQNRWKNTGHVPIKEKDRINNTFRDLASSFYSKLKKVTGSGRFVKLDLVSDSSMRTQKVDGEIQRIKRKIRASQEKIDSYGTNILYISKGKSGDSLRKMIQGQIDEEKVKVERFKAQIKEIKAKEEQRKVDAEKAAEEVARKAEEEAKKAEEAAKAPVEAPETPAETPKAPAEEPAETPEVPAEAPEATEAPAEEPAETPATAEPQENAPASEEE